MPDPTPIHGQCAPGFEAVRETFTENFTADREVGASFAAYRDGQLVVDLWAGHADGARTRAWERDTIVNVFSTTKAMTALCAHILVDRGALDVDTPVAHYWPEFAQAGKAAITTRQLLCHTAGLPAVREPLAIDALYDWDTMTSALARETPWWEPGTANGYHAITFGYLVGEVIRRITGQSVGAFLRTEVTHPLGADFHIGLADPAAPRVGEMVAPTVLAGRAPDSLDPASLLGKAMGNPTIHPRTANTLAWRRAEIPAANGHGNARSVARVMAALARGGELDGVRLLRESTLARATQEQRYARDLVLPLKMRWGLGFMLTSSRMPLGPNPRIFGHGGWGGSLAFADLDARVGWAYIMNKMSSGTTGDTRAAGLIGALYGAMA